jgi:hypothetical protein
MTSEQTERLINAFERIADALNRLGTGNAATQMGAIELLAKEINEGFDRLGQSIESLPILELKDN